MMSFGLDHIRHLGRKFLDHAIGILTVKAQPPFTAANSVSAALGQSLHDGHSAFDTISTGTLSFTVDIKNGCTVNVDHVSAGENDILVRLLAEVESGNIDHLAKGLAVAHANHDSRVIPCRSGSSGRRQHVTDATDRFKRKPPRTVDLAEYAHLIPAHLQYDDIDLWLPNETTALERSSNLFFRTGDRQAADFNVAYQGISYYPGLGDPRFRSEVRILKNLNAQYIPRSERIIMIALRRIDA